MNVLVLSHLYPNPISNMYGSFVHNQACFLKEHCQIEVVAPVPWFPLPGFGLWSAYRRVPRREVLDGIEVRHPRRFALPRRIFFTKLWRFHLKALLNTVEGVPDIIHAHCAYPDGLAAVEYSRQIGCPVVISVHGHDVRELPAANSRWRTLIARALGQAAAVIVSSRDVRERVRALGVEEGRIHSIPQGVDCQQFKMENARSPGEGGWRILYVGRYDPRKGIGVLLQAMPLVRRRADVRLQLVGGSAASGTAADYRRQVSALQLADCVEFVPEQPHDQIAKFMAAADLFVLPSFYDSFGIALIEAMACGLPVVATRCGGPEDIVDPAVGRLVAVGDAEDLAAGILAVLENYDRYDREAIRQQAEARYDYRQVAAQIHALYEDVLR